MPTATEGDAYMETIQWSRRFTGLKVFLRLAERGLDAIGQEIAEGRFALEVRFAGADGETWSAQPIERVDVVTRSD